MIVYAGKQFWNDFNNGDEALFQDADRPRDNDKFKIKPWMQSGKWDFRWANKNTDLSQIVVKWWSNVPWTSDWNSLNRTIPTLKEKWTASEFIGVGFPSSLMNDGILESLQGDKANNPFVAVKSWTIKYVSWGNQTSMNWQYLEVLKSWLYIVQTSWQFWFPSGYDSSTSYQYKYWVAVGMEINGVFMEAAMNVARCCWTWDTQNCFFIAWIEQGTKLVPMTAHTYTSGTTFVVQWISMIRLW